MLKKGWAAFLSLILVFTLAACGSGNSGQPEPSGGTGGGQQKVTFKLATPDPDEASITVAAKQFAKVVSEKSNGSIEIQVSPNGSLYGGDPSAAVKQLGAGSLDMLALSTSLYANFQPQFSAISIPYLFENKEHFLDFLNGEPGQKLLQGLESMNIKGLSFWTRNFRQITNSKHPIAEPKDLQGLRLRVPNNPLWVEFFKAAGAVTTPMAFGEVYNALQLKTIDGQENPAEIPKNAKFYEVQKYLTISNHMADAWVIGINKNKFEKLSAEQQQILLGAAKEVQAWAHNYDNGEELKAIEFLKSNGMEVNTLTPEQREKFAAISQQLFPKFKELVKDDEFFNTVLQFVGKQQ